MDSSWMWVLMHKYHFCFVIVSFSQGHKISFALGFIPLAQLCGVMTCVAVTTPGMPTPSQPFFMVSVLYSGHLWQLQ